MDDTIDIFIHDASSGDLALWKKRCPTLSPEQLLELIPFAIQVCDHKHWREKLALIFLLLPPHLPLEAFGKTLSEDQILEILRQMATPSKSPLSRQQLASLFIGVTSATFQQILLKISEQQLSVLREEAVTEVIQHHLSLLLHLLNEESDSLDRDLQEEQQLLENIELETLSTQEIDRIYISLEAFEYIADLGMMLVGRALSIAWNSNRVDLIQDLGRIKELGQRYLSEVIGHATTDQQSSSGLWHLLEKRINLLFSDQDGSGNITFMNDSTPALEALTKFSIWYVQDYYEIGLLPHIKSPAKLEKLSKANGGDDLEYRAKLLTIAEQNLSRLGLTTLRDLKAAKIYSRQSLIDYIKEKQLALSLQQAPF